MNEHHRRWPLTPRQRAQHRANRVVGRPDGRRVDDDQGRVARDLARLLESDAVRCEAEVGERHVPSVAETRDHRKEPPWTPARTIARVISRQRRSERRHGHRRALVARERIGPRAAVARVHEAAAQHLHRHLGRLPRPAHRGAAGHAAERSSARRRRSRCSPPCANKPQLYARARNQSSDLFTCPMADGGARGRCRALRVNGPPWRLSFALLRRAASG
eukprot:7063603-Prymnesium_polylepis.2